MITDLNYQIATLRKENIGLFEQNSKLVQQNIVITEDLRMYLIGSNQMENPGILSMPRMIDPLNSSETRSLPTTTAEVSRIAEVSSHASPSCIIVF